ncbi:protein transport protein HofC [Pasteurella langaaensis DSM 22999]|uniref:Protein transport protein HofC n=1 Tax=Alitibacter langaaensis DSM 22999 TaxID=1122935 RepID=A0A2U0T5C1_9PAST|nr:protein transport protein HofC [Pasteurella langaaensis DSM 22999]
MKLKLYRWKATDHLNQRQQGMIVAESESAAKQVLFSRGLQHLRVQHNIQLFNKPKQAEICDLLTQLATLLNAAVPLKTCLQILLQNCVNIPLNQWLRGSIADIESGLSFSQSLESQKLEKQNAFLSTQERQLIKIGEITGKLATVCQQISEHKQQVLSLQRKMQKILLYPAIILITSLILTALLLIFIVPQFAEMYGEKQTELPMFTAILLALSNGLQHYFWHIVILFALAIWLIKYQLRHSLKINQYKAKMMTRLPILGKILSLSRLVLFCRSLQLMLQSGVPLNQALQSFLPQKKAWQPQMLAQEDIVLIHEVENMLHGITQGHSFSSSVSANLFPMQAQ